MRAFIAALAAAVLSACSPIGLLNATVPSNGTSVTRDVRFSDGPRGTLDIYRPAASAEPAPLVVFLYGGSWRMGDKSIYPFVATPLASRGAVVVVPDYRVYPEVAFPDFLRDNARAVAWAFDHAAELGADPNAVFVLGHSAGAYNAAMLALDPKWLAAVGVDRARLAGVVGIAGPYDFLPITGRDIIPVFASVDGGPLSQPITFADGHNPPMLLLAGDADTTVQARNTASLAARIGERGGPVESRVYPGVGHIGIVTAFAPLFQHNAPVLDDVWQFITARRPQS